MNRQQLSLKAYQDGILECGDAAGKYIVASRNGHYVAVGCDHSNRIQIRVWIGNDTTPKIISVLGEYRPSELNKVVIANEGTVAVGFTDSVTHIYHRYESLIGQQMRTNDSIRSAYESMVLVGISEDGSEVTFSVEDKEDRSMRVIRWAWEVEAESEDDKVETIVRSSGVIAHGRLYSFNSDYTRWVSKSPIDGTNMFVGSYEENDVEVQDTGIYKHPIVFSDDDKYIVCQYMVENPNVDNRASGFYVTVLNAITFTSLVPTDHHLHLSNDRISISKYSMVNGQVFAKSHISKPIIWNPFKNTISRVEQDLLPNSKMLVVMDSSTKLIRMFFGINGNVYYHVVSEWSDRRHYGYPSLMRNKVFTLMTAKHRMENRSGVRPIGMVTVVLPIELWLMIFGFISDFKVSRMSIQHMERDLQMRRRQEEIHYGISDSEPEFDSDPDLENDDDDNMNGEFEELE